MKKGLKGCNIFEILPVLDGKIVTMLMSVLPPINFNGLELIAPVKRRDLVFVMH